jgi:hypothetical protein
VLSKLELPGFLRLGGTGGLAAGFSNIREALIKTWSEDRRRSSSEAI